MRVFIQLQDTLIPYLSSAVPDSSSLAAYFLQRSRVKPANLLRCTLPFPIDCLKTDFKSDAEDQPCLRVMVAVNSLGLQGMEASFVSSLKGTRTLAHFASIDHRTHHSQHRHDCNA